MPALPRPCERISGLEREAPTAGERVADRGERGAHLVVVDEDLEGVTGHDGQVELAVERHRRRRARHPLDVGAAPSHAETRRVRIQPAQPSGMPGLPGPVQERPGPAADVEHRIGVHHQREVEVIARPPRVEHAIERRRLVVRVHCVSI
jgi:hypothetical protein